MDGYANRIREEREKKGWSQSELAERCNTTNQQISRLEAGQRELTLSWMERLGRALGVNPVHILPPELTQDPFDPLDQTGFEWSDMEGIYVTPWPVPIQREPTGYSPHGCAWFGLEFLAKFNIDPTLCKVVEVRDNSMEKSLPNGSVAMMDGARKELVHEGIYAITTASELLLRRARERSGDWFFVADDENLPPITSDAVTVHGAVVWTARMVRADPVLVK